MSFEEFLMAKGEKEACKLLMSHDYGMMSLLHEKYVDLLRQYYYVGGMPEAVSKYVETGALREVRRIQQEILQIPIEVKAEGNVRANSLMNLLDKVPSLHAERYSMLPYKEQGNLTNIPLYAV